MPRFFWLLLKLHASLYSMYGVPVSTFAGVVVAREIPTEGTNMYYAKVTTVSVIVSVVVR